MINHTRKMILRNFISFHRSSSSAFESAAMKLNSNMKQLINSQRYQNALDIFNQQIRSGNDATFTLALKAAAHLRNYEHGVHIHRQLSNQSMKNPWIQTSLIHFYMQCNDIRTAENIFSLIDNKTVFDYGVMFKGYIRNDMTEKVFELFKNMTVPPNDVIYILVLHACAKQVTTDSIQVGSDILRRLPSNFHDSTNLATAAIDMLMKFSQVKQAEELFASMKKKTLISYGAMMQGYVDNKMPEKALDLFEKLPEVPDDVSYVIVFSACGLLKNDRAIQFGYRIRDGMSAIQKENPNVVGSMLNMLMKFGQVDEAESIFRSTKNKTQKIYGTMMQGYMDNDMPQKVLDLFENLSESANSVIRAIVLNACASLSNEQALQVGNQIYRNLRVNDKNHIVLLGSMLNMLLKFGQVNDAECLFSQIKQPTIQIYGIMMHGYNTNRLPRSSWTLFQKIKEKRMTPDGAVFFALINAASQIGMQSFSRTVIDQLPPEYRTDLKFNNALIDMWGKSLNVHEAMKIFQSITHPNIYIYNTMLNAYGRNGMGAEAVDLFRTIPEKMRDDISCVCVLNACSHAGLIDQALQIYQQIETKTSKIVTTMVDCLSRMFMFNEAQRLIDEYEESNPPLLIMYMTMLSGVRNARQSSLAQAVYDRMKLLFPNYKSDLIPASILLSNIYTSIGDYAQAKDIRDHRLQNYGHKVQPGLTMTLVDGKFWEFKAHDHSHPRSNEIYAKLEEIMMKLKTNGYEANSAWITRPLDKDASVEEALCSHSEKLAIAFNLIQDPQPTVIELTKNLRICGDCHAATKLIAKIYQCHIFARDANRGHHFHPNGQCSCLDHF